MASPDYMIWGKQELHVIAREMDCSYEGKRWLFCQGFEKKDEQEKALTYGKLSEEDDIFEDFEMYEELVHENGGGRVKEVLQ